MKVQHALRTALVVLAVTVIGGCTGELSLDDPDGRYSDAGVFQTYGNASGPLERSLIYVGTDGSMWVHLFTRPAGSDAISARTVRIDNSRTPPFGTTEVRGIRPGSSVARWIYGKTSDGQRFRQTIAYNYARGEVLINQGESINGTDTGPFQRHGIASVNPNDGSVRKEWSLLYTSPSDGSRWMHLVRRTADSNNINVITLYYDPALKKGARNFTIPAVPPNGCKKEVLVTRYNQTGAHRVLNTVVCRRNRQVQLMHSLRDQGVVKSMNLHGVLSIDAP